MPSYNNLYDHSSLVDKSKFELTEEEKKYISYKKGLPHLIDLKREIGLSNIDHFYRNERRNERVSKSQYDKIMYLHNGQSLPKFVCDDIVFLEKLIKKEGKDRITEKALVKIAFFVLNNEKYKRFGFNEEHVWNWLDECALKRKKTPLENVKFYYDRKRRKDIKIEWEYEK